MSLAGAIRANAGALPGLHAAGVFGFKAFLADRGVKENLGYLVHGVAS